MTEFGKGSATESDEGPATESGEDPSTELEDVVYLLGAGASHGCVSYLKSAHGILMRDLGSPLHSRLRELYKDDPRLHHLVNEVIDEDTDFEQIITFLEQSSSALHKAVAAQLRAVFEDVLRERFEQIQDEQGRTPDDLYLALLDLHRIDGTGERLRGFLTVNYDAYLESAIRRLPNHDVDLGIKVWEPKEGSSAITVLKLHGSFDWVDSWPVRPSDRTASEPPLWIPPGIVKEKHSYPFNVLWGLARELLDCDVLRIVGLNLGANDWDLISMLFTTRTAREPDRPYRVELINSPERTFHLRSEYPYLDVNSILDIDPIGGQIISEELGGSPRSFEELSEDERDRLFEKTRGQNWFHRWLQLRGEALEQEGVLIETDVGALFQLMEEGR